MKTNKRGIITITITAAALALHLNAQTLDQVESGKSAQFKGGAYYSLMLHQPPLPFNPFPDLPLFDFGDGKFAYDDRTVDYEKLRASQEKAATGQMAGNRAMPAAASTAPAQRSVMISAEATGGGFQAANAGPPAEQLEFQLGPGGTNTLILSQLVIDSQYYVVAKQDITPNIDNPW
jgi:hypothetical protein